MTIVIIKDDSVRWLTLSGQWQQTIDGNGRLIYFGQDMSQQRKISGQWQQTIDGNGRLLYLGQDRSQQRKIGV